MPVVSKRSKRSSKVALTTMAAIGGGAMLSACGGEPAAPVANAITKDTNQTEVQVFENIFACAKETGKTREECDQMRQEALAKADEEAPRFAALQDCEAQYGAGQCVEAAAGTEETQGERRHFSPFVVAWFSSNRNASGPLFKNKAGGYQSANGSRVSFAGQPGKYTTSNRAFERPKSVPKVKPASRLAKKGGFGGRSTGWNLSDRDDGKSKRSASNAGSSRSKGG
ncbi:DUF1190 domain-containing protein [Erythrobacter crassostreae]|uniref:DUF1190 domain-containing protein n=1 Tax=Erythrobacter crassostreae TaxID=2828328 RepID=A0A9X1JPK2_9SPHN|nr:DUF1190 domain-containing protein [Erythrobacter crassostrea]MBV7259507.1 DUF1190 domain-containing protein [Erythrobacter crassostrea]